MIAFIKGKVVNIHPAAVIVETAGGVAYEINISLSTFSEIKDLAEISLLTHFVVKEDAQMLFGFHTEEERTLFRWLISVSGIGVNTARLILSSLSVAECVHAITTEQVQVIQKVKGIGQKSAQKIIIDLKDKIGKSKITFSDSALVGTCQSKNEALAALVSLGFAKNSSEQVLDKVIKAEGNNMTVEELIKKSLKIL